QSCRPSQGAVFPLTARPERSEAESRGRPLSPSTRRLRHYACPEPRRGAGAERPSPRPASPGTSGAEQRLANITGGNRPLREQLLVKAALIELPSLDLPHFVPQRKDLRLAQVISDRLGRPLRVAVHRLLRRLDGRTLDGGRIPGRVGGDGALHEVDVPREVLDSLVEAHVPAVNAGVHHDAGIANQLSLELKQMLFRRIETL